MAYWIKWYGPKSGRGSVEDIVSHKPQVKAELALQASQIAARASSNLNVSPKRRTGESSIGLEGPASGRKLDWVVYLDSGEGNKGASAGIEQELGILAESVGRAIRRGVSAAK